MEYIIRDVRYGYKSAVTKDIIIVKIRKLHKVRKVL